jgi:hypothetical protein
MAFKTKTATSTEKWVNNKGRMASGIGHDATVSDYHDLGPVNQVTG